MTRTAAFLAGTPLTTFFASSLSRAGMLHHGTRHIHGLPPASCDQVHVAVFVAPRACAISDAIEAAASGTRPASPDESPFAAKYGHLRGVEVEPVSAAVARFTTRFAKPVPAIYRTLVNELVVSTHLSRVCALWRYCSLFALGIDDVFTTLLQFYPQALERQELYEAVAYALSFNRQTLAADAEAVRQWCIGKTEQDVFDAAAAAEGPVGKAIAQAARGFPVDEWYYSRPFGVGLIRVMEAVGVALTVADMERWATTLSLPKGKLVTEMGQFLSAVERLKQAEQMFAQIAARDAKKAADKLAERAKAAKAAADALEADVVANVDSVDEKALTNVPAASAVVDADSK